jgi:hypothetical protein
MNTDFKTQLLQELPDLLENDPDIRQSVVRMATPYFAPRQETDNRFDQQMAELRQMREESERKWAENQQRWEENWAEIKRMREESERKWAEYKAEQQRAREESERKWAEYKAEQQRAREESERKWAENQQRWEAQKQESERKWAENQQRWEAQKQESERKWAENQAELQRMREESERKWAENQAELQRMREESERKWEEQKEEADRKWEENQRKLRNDVKKQLDASLGAIGARWGVRSEASFRNAMRALLEDVPDIQVKHVDVVDEAGETFGRPANIELDVVIHNGTLTVCEIKSSVSGADVDAFYKKVQFYKKYHHPQQEIARLVMISPMLDKGAKQAAEFYGIQIYSYMDDAFAEEQAEEA